MTPQPDTRQQIRDEFGLDIGAMADALAEARERAERAEAALRDAEEHLQTYERQIDALRPYKARIETLEREGVIEALSAGDKP